MSRIRTALVSLFRDGAFRYGIKFGVAGVLAVALALVIQLPMPTWALFTVFVLMIAQYVGAIAEKSIFRVIGTVIGALLGYLLTASLQQNPVVYLLLVGLIVAFSVAMFGQSRYPYAFLLCGMTVVVVTSNGMGNPEMSWQFALFRVEEVTIGILAAIIVQSILWPRYARAEFGTNIRAALADLKDCFDASAPAFFEGGTAEATQRAIEFPARITALRQLLDFGARESQYFRDRLSTYFEITSCLSRISSAIVTLERTLPPGSTYNDSVKEETHLLHQAISDAMMDLSQSSSSVESRKQRRDALDGAFDAFEARIIELRRSDINLSMPTDDLIAIGIHVLSLAEVRDQIRLLGELLDSLPEDYSVRPRREPPPFVSPVPPPFWIKAGIKSGIVVIIALVLDNWLKPPGGAMFVLGAWVFTTLNATSPGGRGDRRAFHYVIVNTLIMIGVSILLLLTTPMMASYAVMNTLIFTWLFVWGYLSYTTRGVTVPMQFCMLLIVGILGLNAQEPVGFQQIADNFFGIVFALVVASLVQRVFCPSLPQWELRDRFIELTRTCRKLIELGPKGVPLWQRTRVALIPGEAAVRIALLRPPICPAEQQSRLREYLGSLQRVGGHLVVTIGRMVPLLPPEHAEKGQALIKDIEQEISSQLEAHEKCMESSSVLQIDPKPLSQKLAEWKAWTVDLRTWMVKNGYQPLQVMTILGLSGRYEEAGNQLINANECAGKLRLDLYMGDYVL